MPLQVLCVLSWKGLQAYKLLTPGPEGHNMRRSFNLQHLFKRKLSICILHIHLSFPGPTGLYTVCTYPEYLQALKWSLEVHNADRFLTGMRVLPYGLYFSLTVFLTRWVKFRGPDHRKKREIETRSQRSPVTAPSLIGQRIILDALLSFGGIRNSQS